MPILFSLENARDLIVVIYGIVGILFFAVAIVISVALFFTVKHLIHAVNELLDETVKPTVNSIKDAAETVRGTTEFVGQTAISPIVRTYGTFAGVRKGLGVLSGLNSRRKKG